MCRSRCDTTDAGRAVLGALGAAGWAAGRFPAVTVPPPRRPRVDAHAPRPAQGLPPRRHRIDEDPQRRRPLAAVIALEGAPLALVGGEVRTGADQGEDLQPVRVTGTYLGRFRAQFSCRLGHALDVGGIECGWQLQNRLADADFLEPASEIA